MSREDCQLRIATSRRRRSPGAIAVASLPLASLTLASLMLLLAAGPLAAQTSNDDRKLLAKASELIGQKRYKDASSLVEGVLKRAPNEPDGWRLRGHIAFATGAREEARKAFLEALSLGRFSADVVGRLVIIDRDAGRKQAWLSELRLMLMLEPENEGWRRLLIEAAHEAGELALERRLLGELRAESPADGELVLRMGLIAWQQGERETALAELSLAWELGRRKAGLAGRIAALAASLERPSVALRWLDRVKTPSREQQSLRARLLRDVGSLDAAAKLAESLAAGDDAIARGAAELRARIALDRLGDGAADESDEAARAAIGKLEGEVVQWWQRARKLGAKDPRLLSALGVTLRRRGKDAEAAEVFAEAVRLGESRSSILRARVEALHAAGRADDARAALCDYVARHGYDSGAEWLVRKLARG